MASTQDRELCPRFLRKGKCTREGCDYTHTVPPGFVCHGCKVVGDHVKPHCPRNVKPDYKCTKCGVKGDHKENICPKYGRRYEPFPREAEDYVDVGPEIEDAPEFYGPGTTSGQEWCQWCPRIATQFSTVEGCHRAFGSCKMHEEIRLISFRRFILRCMTPNLFLLATPESRNRFMRTEEESYGLEEMANNVVFLKGQWMVDVYFVNHPDDTARPNDGCQRHKFVLASTILKANPTLQKEMEKILSRLEYNHIFSMPKLRKEIANACPSEVYASEETTKEIFSSWLREWSKIIMS